MTVTEEELENFIYSSFTDRPSIGPLSDVLGEDFTVNLPSGYVEWRVNLAGIDPFYQGIDVRQLVSEILEEYHLTRRDELDCYHGY